MKPILYDEFETEFTSNGLGILVDATDVTVEQSLNGTFELELKYPVFAARFADLKHRAIILATVDPISQPQPFRIYRITKPSKGIVTYYARHVAYDLMGYVVSPFTAAGVAAALVTMKQSSVTDCPFEFTTDKSTAATMTVAAPTAIWTLLGGSEGSILDVYGGEYEFDRWKVNLWNRRGIDRGVTIRYGKNLKSLEQDENCASCYTGVYPYWLGQDGTLVELPEKKLLADGEYTYEKIMPLDLSAEWEEAPTEDQLRTRATKYMTDNQIGVPTVSITVEFVPLAQTEEYKDIAMLEQVLLGDTVSVYFPDMLVTATARAVKTKWKPLLDRYDKVTIGSVRANIADTIVKQQQETAKKPSLSLVQTLMTQLANAFSGVLGGAVRLLDTNGDGMPDELYIADDPDPDKAVEVWRFNYKGWAASKNGYNGPFVFGATLAEGILASAVTAANLVAGTIQSADGGKTVFIDLDNGVVNLQPVSEEIDGIKTYFRVNAKGMYVGRITDDAVLRLSAGKVEVLVAGYAASAFDRTGMTAEQVNVNTVHIGDYTLSQGADNHLTLT